MARVLESSAASAISPNAMSQGNGRRGHDGETMKMVRQGDGEFCIRDRIGNDVDRALYLVMVHAELDNFDQRGECDPAHPLTSITEIAAESHAKQGKHFGKRTTLPGEDHAKAQMDNADSQVDRGIGLGLPLLAYICKETVAGSGIFRQDFISPIAVIADRRGAE